VESLTVEVRANGIDLFAIQDIQLGGKKLIPLYEFLYEFLLGGV